MATTELQPAGETCELSVIVKAYDLVLWTANHVAKFPRGHRFTAGERLERQVYFVLEGLVRAKYQRQRTQILRDTNVELEILRFQFRLAKDLRLISLQSYGHAARSVNEVGQMVGGWLKHSERGNP